MKPLDLPRIGRYRLYDLGPNNRVRCRLCGRWFKRDNAERHAATEILKFDNQFYGQGLFILEERLANILAKRRSRRNLLAARRAKMDDPEWHDRDRERIKGRRSKFDMGVQQVPE